MWLVVDNKMPLAVVAHLPEIAFVLTLYAGLTMVCNAPFFSGKSKTSFKNVPFWALVAGAVVFIVVSSNPSLAIFVLFCLYAVSGYVYQLYLFFMDKPNPVIPGESKPLPEPVSALHEKNLVNANANANAGQGVEDTGAGAGAGTGENEKTS